MIEFSDNYLDKSFAFLIRPTVGTKNLYYSLWPLPCFEMNLMSFAPRFSGIEDLTVAT